MAKETLRGNRDRILYRTVREIDRLHKAKWNSPIIPLEEPYQRGWTRRYKLRDDATRRDDAQRLKYVLKLINTVQFSRDGIKWPSFNGVEIPQALKVIPEKVFEGMKLSPAITKYFLHGHYTEQSLYSSRIVVGYAVHYKYKFYFVYDIQPNIVTHTRVIMPEVESRLSELYSVLEKNGGWNRVDHLKGHRKYRDDFTKESLLDFTIEQTLDEYDQD